MNTQLPDPRDMLPKCQIENHPLCRTSVCVDGWTIAELQYYVDWAISVCRQRDFRLQGIGLPGPALRVLSDCEPDVLGLMGSYEDISLFVHEDYPIVAELELVFNC